MPRNWYRGFRGRGRRANKKFWRGRLSHALRYRDRYTRSRNPSVKTGFLKVQQSVRESIVIPTILDTSPVLRVFDITQLPNLTELQRLFDQYRIKGVKIQFLATTNTNDTTNQGLFMHTSVNLDSGSPPASVDTFLQRANTKTTTFSSAGGNMAKRTVFLRPRHLTEVYRAPPALTNGTALGPPQSWLDIQFSDIPHYGLDCCWSNADGLLNNPMNVSVITTYYLEFRKVK